MVIDHRQHMLTQMRDSISLLSTPIAYAVNSPFGLFDKLSEGIATHQELVTENATLRAQQLLLMGQLQKLETLQQENIQLLALLKSPAHSHSERLLAAEVLAVHIEPFVAEIILNKGKNDAVYIGQAVIDANGIMGQIIQTGPWTSRLLLISDARNAVPIRDNRTGLYGIVIGQGDQQSLAWTNVPVTADVKIGDTLISSGLGGHYPVGYPVGTVYSVNHNPDDQFESIMVTPAAQLNNTSHVLLVWPNKNDRPLDNSLTQPAEDTNKLVSNYHLQPQSAKLTP